MSSLLKHCNRQSFRSVYGVVDHLVFLILINEVIEHSEMLFQCLFYFQTINQLFIQFSIFICGIALVKTDLIVS